MPDDTKIGSGRCHGPGCTQTATVGFFCGEACQAQWDRQLADSSPPVGQIRLHEVTLVDQPLVSEWRVRVAIDDRLSEDSARTFADGVDLADAMVVDHMRTPPPGGAARGPLDGVFEALPPALDGDTEERACEPVGVEEVDDLPPKRAFRWASGRTT